MRHIFLAPPEARLIKPILGFDPASDSLPKTGKVIPSVRVQFESHAFLRMHQVQHNQYIYIYLIFVGIWTPPQLITELVYDGEIWYIYYIPERKWGP